MKLTLSVLALLSCSAHTIDARFPRIKKLAHRPSDPAFDSSSITYNVHHLQAEGPSRPALAWPKRADTSPSPPVIKFLPPPWSPSSSLDSPYPLVGMNPYSDDGRSEVLDNEPAIQTQWRTCPVNNLDCTKCPKDKRCRHSGLPWWQIDPTIILDNNGGATGGAKNSCPLTKCNAGSGKNRGCGENARCVRDHCVCETGFKGSVGSVRGFDDLQAVTVWVSGGMNCNVKCDTLSCGEVDQVDACFERASKVGVDNVETATTGGGSVMAPGALGQANRVRRDGNYCGV